MWLWFHLASYHQCQHRRLRPIHPVNCQRCRRHRSRLIHPVCFRRPRRHRWEPIHPVLYVYRPWVRHPWPLFRPASCPQIQDHPSLQSQPLRLQPCHLVRYPRRRQSHPRLRPRNPQLRLALRNHRSRAQCPLPFLYRRCCPRRHLPFHFPKSSSQNFVPSIRRPGVRTLPVRTWGIFSSLGCQPRSSSLSGSSPIALVESPQICVSI